MAIAVEPVGTLQGGQYRLRLRSRGTLLLLGVLALYFWLSLLRSGMKPLWFDELGTLTVASQPTLAQMFRVEPGDGNPPLQYLLVRACLHLFGTHAFALRLPAMLGVGLAVVCAYVFVGRRFGPAAGLVGAVAIVFSLMSDYGVEARPYGLLLGLTALLLVLWQEAARQSGGRPVDRPGNRRVLLAGMALTVFALVITQPLGLFWACLPVGAAETSRRWTSGRWDRGVLAAGALGLSGFAVTLHFGQATQRVLVAEGGTRHPAISLPTLSKFGEALTDYGLVPLLIVLVPLGALAWRHRDAWTRRAKRSGAPPHEWVAAAALALTLFPVYLFTRVVTHYFWGRYLLPGMLGWTLLLAMVCGLVGRRWVMAVVLMALLPLNLYFRYRTAAKMPWPSPDTVYAQLRQGDPTEPVVIGSPVLFSEVRWYAPASLRPRLHYIADAHQATNTDDFVGDLTLIAFRNAGADLFPPDSLGSFLPRHRRFLLWQGKLDPGDWVKPYLLQRGYRFTQVTADGSGNRLYQVEAPVAAG